MTEPKDCPHLSHTPEGICHGCGAQHQSMIQAESNDTYLGDGVYASYDGYHVWLTTGAHYNPKLIALEPVVMIMLVDYAKRHGMLKGTIHD